MIRIFNFGAIEPESPEETLPYDLFGDSVPKLYLWPAILIGRIAWMMVGTSFHSGGGDMTSRRQNPVGPALIIVLFLAFFVFLLVSRKGDTGAFHPQSASQNR